MNSIYSLRRALSLCALEWLILLSIILSNSRIITASVETIDTIVYKDAQGIEHEEYAFIAPMKDYPDHVLKMYCANVKLRLYWNVYREEIELNLRKGLYLRRIARFAQYAFDDIPNADGPFDAPRLSKIEEDFDMDDEINQKGLTKGEILNEDSPKTKKKGAMLNMLSFAKKSPTQNQAPGLDKNNEKKLNEVTQEIVETNQLKSTSIIEQVKNFVHKYGPSVGIGIYTRVRTMWWLMYPCVFTKYYLWDTALDEFMKLKRSLVMYPDMQMVRLQDLECAPLKLFKRVLDACKILNPLMNFSFGQFNLESATTRDHVDKL